MNLKKKLMILLKKILLKLKNFKIKYKNHYLLITAIWFEHLFDLLHTFKFQE
jgi:hypothetical protein